MSGLPFNVKFARTGTVAVTGLIIAAFPCAAQLQSGRTIILIGAPGSGKTVQAEYLRKRFKIPAISMSQLIQQEIDRGASTSKLLAASVSSGELLGDGPANELMKARLLRPDAGRGFILDGYPVTQGQAQALDAWIIEHNLPKPAVIILDIPEEVSRTRLLRRKRPDDTSANIERRLREYREAGLLVEQWYGTQRTTRVSGTGTVTEVAKRVVDAVESIGQEIKLKTRNPESEGLKQRDPAP